MADIVEKVFLGRRTKILRAADAFCARRSEGPYRFIPNRSRVSVAALKSDAAAGKSKDQLSRDFPGRSIFDFCNNIGHNRTSANRETECSQHRRAEHIRSDDERAFVGRTQICNGRIEFEQAEMTYDELPWRSLLSYASDDSGCRVQGNVGAGRDCQMHDEQVSAPCKLYETRIGPVLVGAEHDRHVSGLHAIGQ